MDKNKLAESIEYAIRNNAMEGLITSPETMDMLDRVKKGELTFDDMRKAIIYKADALGKGVKITLAEAWIELQK